MRFGPICFRKNHSSPLNNRSLSGRDRRRSITAGELFGSGDDSDPVIAIEKSSFFDQLESQVRLCACLECRRGKRRVQLFAR